MLVRFDCGLTYKLDNHREVDFVLVSGTNPNRPNHKDCLLITHKDGRKASMILVDHRSLGVNARLISKHTREKNAVDFVRSKVEESQREGSIISVTLALLFIHFASKEQIESGMGFSGTMRLIKNEMTSHVDFAERCSEVIQFGDKLERPLDIPGLFHHGIALDSGAVLDYNHTQDASVVLGLSSVEGRVDTQSLLEFLDGKNELRVTYVLYRKNPMLIEDSVQDFQGSKYNLLANNCEHFANRVTQGEQKSKQVDRAGQIAGLAALTVAGGILAAHAWKNWRKRSSESAMAVVTGDEDEEEQ